LADSYAFGGPFLDDSSGVYAQGCAEHLDLAAALAVGGLWFFFFAGQLKRLPVLPVGDPKLAEAIANEH